MTEGLRSADATRIIRLGTIVPVSHDEVGFMISYADGRSEMYNFSFGRKSPANAGIGIIAIRVSGSESWNDSASEELAVKAARRERDRLAKAWDAKVIH